MTSRPMYLRSMHFVPGPNERMLEKAIASDADGLILDLEDSVPSVRKNDARDTIAAWLSTGSFGNKKIFVRINPIDSAWGMADIQACSQSRLDGFVIPKVERREDLARVDHALEVCERERNIEMGRIGVIPIATETALGALQISQLTNVPRLRAVTWGAEDLMSAIGALRNRDASGNYFPLYEHCRVQTLLVATAAGVPAIDTVYTDLRDLEGLRKECKYSAELGFLGKLTIHPAQIEIVNSAFTPPTVVIEECERLIEAFEDARKQGLNAIQFEGKMVDEPHYRRAQQILERTRIAGIR